MLWDVESIVDGTWGGSGPMPAEWFHFSLMRGMRWTWRDLTGETGGTPDYVQRYCADFLNIIAEHDEAEADRARRDAERANKQGR